MRRVKAFWNRPSPINYPANQNPHIVAPGYRFFALNSS